MMCLVLALGLAMPDLASAPWHIKQPYFAKTCRPNWTGSAGGAGPFTRARLAGAGEGLFEPQPTATNTAQPMDSKRRMGRLRLRVLVADFLDLGLGGGLFFGRRLGQFLVHHRLLADGA